MELIERYLRAIEFWLPAGQKQDILAEISEDLHSQIEERQMALGRELNDGELEALLRSRGRPMLVANRYRPQRSLIGPDWFPTYVFVLKIVGFCYVLPWWVIYFVVHRVEHLEATWGLTWLAALGTAWDVAIFSTAAVTAIFVCLQLAAEKSRFFEDWNPRQLPAARDAMKIPRANSLAELVFGVAFVLWWIGYADTLVPFDGPSFRLALHPVWFDYFWGCLGIGVANLILSILNLRHPYWSTARAAWRLAGDLAGGALFCWLMRVDLLDSLWIGNLDAARTLAIKNAIHSWLTQCFPIAVVVVVAIAVVDLFRIVRVGRRGKGGLIESAAVSAQ